MESPINSSFIPTKISLGERPREEYGSDAFDVMVLLGVIALVVAGTMAAGVFLYKQFLANDLAAKKEQLNKAKKAFQPDLVRDLTRLDERISIAEGVLQSHIAPSAFFDVLSQITLKTIEYKGLEYEFTGTDSLHVVMNGRAASVNGIAYQARVMSTHPAIKNPIFSIGNITKDGVEFTVELDINPEAVNFASLISAAAVNNQDTEQGFIPNEEGAAPADSEEGAIEEEATDDQPAAQRGVPRGGTDVGTPTKQRPASQNKKTAPDELFGNFE
jgi:hypothetical protein